MTGKTPLCLLFALLLALATAGSSYANIDTPQGALDVAGITPGKYAFLDRQKYPQTKKDNDNIVRHTPVSRTDSTVSVVEELVELMKQATEIAADISQEEDAQPAAASAPMLHHGAHAALNIACILPRSSVSSMSAFMQVDPHEMIKARKMVWPTDGFIYSAFNATRGRKRHGAIDIVNKKGTPIVAAAGGTVSIVANGGKGFSGYGKVVIIDHGKGIHTLYSHCDRITVKIGQNVGQGELIATMGRTGRASTDHLHFEVRVSGKKIDPLACIPERPGVVKATNYHSPKKKAN